MINITKLIDATDGDSVAEGLAAFCAELAEQLTTKARERAARNTRGHKSYGEHIATAVLELNAVADALRKHAAAATPAEPIVCPAVNQLGGRCVRTDAGHTSHTYAPVEPETAVCGTQDRYGGDNPDRCKRPPHGRDSNHEGAYSKWPWQDEQGSEFHPYVSAPPAIEVAHEIRTPSPEAIAYLKGERDDLGTEPLFIEPSGELERQGRLYVQGRMPAIAAQLSEALDVPLAYIEPRGEQVVTGTLHGTVVNMATGETRQEPLATPVTPEQFMEAAVTSDPFDNALPEAPKRTGVWTGGAEPVEPDPRPLWLPGWTREAWPEMPSSIRTTQVRTGEACGLQYRLISRDQVPEVPSWANIGGTALHLCAQVIEENILHGFNAETITEEAARSLWAVQFAHEIRTVEAENPFPRSTWRKGGKGAEGEDWWNEVGPLMVRDYSAASAQWHTEGWSILPVPGVPGPPDPATGVGKPFIGPAMELELRTPLMNGELTGHLDQAWYRLNLDDPEISWEILIRDLKTGRELPDDDWQLEAYAFGLRHRLQAAGMDVSKIAWSAVYYDARNGKDGEVKTPQINTAEITYRASAVLGMHAANNYPANPGDTWKAPCYLCAVRYACPIMALK